MTHSTGRIEHPPGSWAQELVMGAVPPEVDALRSVLQDVANTHPEDSEVREAVAEVRAALDRLSLVLIRDAAVKESRYGMRRRGIRWSRSPDDDR
jgi:hypothetical protein